MLDITYTHFEGFGGALVNNVIGFVSNGFTELTFGMLSDPITMFGATILFGIAIFIYAFLKGEHGSANQIIFGSSGFDNIFVRAALVYFLFIALMHPIPVVQMTPVITYENNASAAGVNQGDRSIAGWLVNDLKTTVNLNTPEAGKKEEVMTIPLAFAPLGLVQQWYYGFPAISIDDFIEEVDESDSSNVKYRYKDVQINSGLPSLLSCAGSTEKANELKKFEGSIAARYDIGDLNSLNSTCKTNLQDGGEWKTNVEDSIMVLLFGASTPSELLSDYFEPIDRAFYYLSMSPISQVIQDRLKVVSSQEIPKKQLEELVNIWEGAKDANGVTIGDGIRDDFFDQARDNIYNADVAIEKSLLDTIDRLEEIAALNPKKAFPKEIAQAILQVILDNEPIKQAWRRNLPSPQAADANQSPSPKEIEQKAIPQVQINGVTGFDQVIQEAEKKVLDSHTINGISAVPARHLEDIAITATDLNIKQMIYTIYSNMSATLDVGIPNSIIPVAPTADSKVRFLTKGDNVITRNEFLSSIDENYFKPMSQQNSPFIAPTTIQKVDVSSVDGETFSTEKYKNIYAEIWAVERTLASRKMLINYASYLNTYVENLYATIKATTDKCQESDDCTSAFQASSTVALTWPGQGTDGADVTEYLNMVYAGVYPSKIYLSSTSIRAEGDNTKNVLFLPVREVISAIEDSGNELGVISLAPYQEPLKKFYEFVPVGFWSLDSASLNSYIESNPETIRYLKDAFGSDIIDKFRTDTVFSRSVVMLEGNGVDFNYDSLNKRYPGLGDKLKEVLAEFQQQRSVQFEQDKPNYATINNYIGRTVPSTLNQLLIDVKFKAASDTFASSISSYLSSLSSQSAYVNSFYSLVDSMYAYTSDSAGIRVFNPKYADNLLALFSEAGITADQLSKTHYVDILDTYVEQQANKHKIAVEKYIADTVVYTETVEVKSVSNITQATGITPIFEAYFDSLKNLEGNTDTNQTTTLQTAVNEFKNSIETDLKCTVPSDSLSLNDAITQCAEQHNITHSNETVETVAQINVPDSNLKFPLTDTNDQGAVAAISRLAWAGVTVVLNEFRDLQNTAISKTTDLKVHLGSSYRAPMFLGGIPTAANASGAVATDVDVVSRSFVNPDFIPPTISKSLDEIGNIYKKADLGNTESMVDVAIISAVGVLAFSFFGFLLGLSLKVLWELVKFLFLAVFSGAVGFFRAGILFPITFAIWMLTYDFANRRPLQFVSHMSMPSSGWSPKYQFVSAMKLLSVWLLSITVMLVILSIDYLFIEPVMQYLSLNNWVQGVVGADAYWAGTSILMIALVFIYALLISEGYKQIIKYLKNQYSQESPEVRAMLTAHQKLSSVQDKLKSMMPGGGK